jgi:AcrR family transcriptional regulator
MGKSLTEVAKAILMNESNDPAPDRDAKSMTPLKASLRPGSAYADPSPLSNSAQDLGPALVNNTDVPPSAKASGQAKKDTSPSSQSRKGTVPAEGRKSQAEVMEEDVELEEEEQIDENLGTPGKKLEYALKHNVSHMLANITGDKKTSAKRERGAKLFDKKMKKMEEEINEEEEIEISEELEAFIDLCLEEGLSEEEIAEAIDENFELVTEEDETLEEDAEESVMEDYEVDMSEDIEALFSGEELSEEFRAKATAIFEAAVKRKLEEELAAIEEAYAQTLEEQVASIHEELSNNVDDYLNYVVENWMVENEVAIEAGLRTELTEDFISGLHSLFIENYIDIPEDKVSVIEEMGAHVEELTDKLNEEIERNVILNKMLSESQQVEVFNQMTEGLTATQADKLKTLAEGITYDSVEEYAEKVSTLKESYFPSSAVKAPRELDLIEPGTEGRTMIAEELNGPMAKYVKALGKSLPK